MKRTVPTSRFGDIEVQSNHIIHFKDGMVGFSHLKDYFLIESPSLPLLMWLQSVDDPQVAFPVVEPYFFSRDYKVQMIDADRSRLDISDKDQSKNLVVMTIPKDMTQMTVNMKAPVVINLSKGLAVQVIMQDKSLQVRTPAHEKFTKALANVTEFDSDSEEAIWTPVNPLRAPSLQGELSS